MHNFWLDQRKRKEFLKVAAEVSSFYGMSLNHFINLPSTKRDDLTKQYNKILEKLNNGA